MERVENLVIGHTESEKRPERKVLEQIQQEGIARGKTYPAIDSLLKLTDKELEQIDRHLSNKGKGFGHLKNLNGEAVLNTITSLMNTELSEDEKESLRKQLTASVEAVDFLPFLT